MKKFLSAVFAITLVLSGCGSSAVSKDIDTLKVSFVPSAPADEILQATAPLGEMLKKQMAEFGYSVENIEITVGSSYEEIGEGLADGSIDIGLIPGGTYVLYEDAGVELALTATRGALNIDSVNPEDWNNTRPEKLDEDATSYHSLIIAGPSKKGQALQDKVAAGDELTFDELADATWCVQSPSSSAGYLYPTLWLSENYDGKTINDLPYTIEVIGYEQSISGLSTSQCDIAPMYADARLDNQTSWTNDQDIFESTSVIGVTNKIMNDTVSVSRNSEVYSDDFVKAVQKSFINIASTDEGIATMEPYSHTGYEIGNEEDYDTERAVEENVVANL